MKLHPLCKEVEELVELAAKPEEDEEEGRRECERLLGATLARGRRSRGNVDSATSQDIPETGDHLL